MATLGSRIHVKRACHLCVRFPDGILLVSPPGDQLGNRSPSTGRTTHAARHSAHPPATALRAGACDLSHHRRQDQCESPGRRSPRPTAATSAPARGTHLECPANPARNRASAAATALRDGCNVCTCLGDGSWHCTDDACPSGCEPGATQDAEDGCNTCTCSDEANGCARIRPARPRVHSGDVIDAGDGCNTCECVMVLDVAPRSGSAPRTPARAAPARASPRSSSTSRVDRRRSLGDGRRPVRHSGPSTPSVMVSRAPRPGHPCTAAGCAFAGQTIVDSTYEAWGCGLGVSSSRRAARIR